MKKNFVFLSIIVFLLLLSCACDNKVALNENKPDESAFEQTGSAIETVETGSFDDAEQRLIDFTEIGHYSFVFFSYFHDVYNPGDALDADPVTELCLFNAIIHRDEFDFVTYDPTSMSVTLSREDLRKIADVIFSDNQNISDRYYNKDKQLYDAPLGRTWGYETFMLGTEQPVVLNETGSSFSVSVTFKKNGDSGDIETLIYTFDKVSFQGTELYKIREIKKA